MLKAILLSLVTLSAANAAQAQTCYRPQLNDFAAYAIGDMDVRNSDHQGLSGAGGNLSASHFLFEGNSTTCLAMSAGETLTFSDGKTLQDIEAGKAIVSNVSIESMGRVGKINTLYGVEASKKNSSYKKQMIEELSTTHVSIEAELTNRSAHMSGLPDTMQVEDNGSFVLNLKSGENVVSFDANILSARPKVVINGPADATLIINVRGAYVMLDGMNVELQGSIAIANISWNFPNATYLLIVRTANAAYGIPGRLLAPCARAEFYEGLITGSLWVKDLIFMLREFPHSGQINRIPEPCNCSR